MMFLIEREAPEQPRAARGLEELNTGSSQQREIRPDMKPEEVSAWTELFSRKSVGFKIDEQINAYCHQR